MANISVYKLVLADQDINSLYELYPTEKRSDIDSIIKKLHIHDICVKDSGKIILPSGKEIINFKEIFDYYLYPNKRKRPANIDEIESIIDDSKQKIIDVTEFKWINI